MSGTFSEYKENYLKTIAFGGQDKAGRLAGNASRMRFIGLPQAR
jgi:hypothetical protein